LNSRPHHYQWCALPLSYRSIPVVTCHKRLRFATLRDVSWLMSDKPVPKRTLDRKKREAEALKANMKKRKDQAKLEAGDRASSNKSNENQSE
jgi:hypothetical protein